MARHIITDDERGVKPRISKTEELQRWTACTLPSQKKYVWSKGGQKYLRYIIQKDMLDNNKVRRQNEIKT